MRRQGIPFNSGYKLGILVETPAAALEAVELARHSDFFSIGTNDLTQYTLAVDRNSARLAKLFNPPPGRRETAGPGVPGGEERGDRGERVR